MTYFTYPNAFVPTTLVRAEVMNQRFNEVVSAFALVATDVETLLAGIAAAQTAASTASTRATTALSAATSAQAAAVGAMPKAGGAFTGTVTLAADATTGLQPVTYQQLMSAIASSTAGVSSFNSRAGAVTLRAADITALGSLALSLGSVLTITGAAGQNTAGLSRSGNAVILAENVGSPVDSLRIGADHAAHVFLNGVDQFNVDASGNASTGGLIFGRTTGGGTAGMGLGRVFIQATSAPLPISPADGDIVLQF